MLHPEHLRDAIKILNYNLNSLWCYQFIFKDLPQILVYSYICAADG